jgi:Predicted membrane-associated HD superfamily hydrolase
MKKSSFVAMIMGTIGGILTSLGICMCLLPAWNAFQPGVIMGCVGLVILLATVIVWRKMTNKDSVRMSGKTLLAIILGVVGALMLGVGMCLAMVWSQMIFGIILGIAGIILLIFLIPLVKGLK